MSTSAATVMRAMARTFANKKLLPMTAIRLYHLSSARSRPLASFPASSARIAAVRQYSSDVPEQIERLGSVDSSILQLQYESENVPLIVRLFKTTLESVHDGSMLGCAVPWWGVIVLSVAVLRLGITTPAYIFQQRRGEKIRKLDKVVPGWTVPVVKSIVAENINTPLTDVQIKRMADKRIRAKRNKMMWQNGCHPFLTACISLSHLPIWMSMSMSLRLLCQSNVLPDSVTKFMAAPGMTTEGLLWFKDLSACDPTYILPVCTGAMYMLNVAMIHKKNIEFAKNDSLNDKTAISPLPQVYKNVVNGIMFAIPLIITSFAAQAPAAISLYWLLSASFTTVVHSLRRHKRTRDFFQKS